MSGAAATPSVAADGAGPSSGQSPGEPSPPAVTTPVTVTGYRPDGVPEHMLGATDKETMDRMNAALKGFRDDLAKRGTVPKDVAEYSFDWSAELKPYTADIENDVLFKGVKEDALEAGLTVDQAGKFLNKAMTRMVTMGLLENPVDLETAKAEMAPPEARGLPPAERDTAIQRRVAANMAFVDGLARDGLPAPAVEALKAELAGFAPLNALFEHLRQPGVGPALNGNPAPAVSESDLRARTADPRNTFGNAKYDPVFAAETTRLYQQHYPAGSSPR